jgi:hypothetical protein
MAVFDKSLQLSCAYLPAWQFITALLGTHESPSSNGIFVHDGL